MDGGKSVSGDIQAYKAKRAKLDESDVPCPRKFVQSPAIVRHEEAPVRKARIAEELRLAAEALGEDVRL